MSATYPPPDSSYPPPPPPGRQPGIKDYLTAYLQGGAPAAMQMGGMQPPGWMSAITNFLQRPEVNTAMGVMTPMKGAPKGNWLDEVRGALKEPAAKPSATENLASRIEDTYNKLKSEKRYHFIDIADVKDAMPDVPLADLHAELKNNPRFGTYPNDNRASLTQRDHDAALKIGAGRPQHKMFLVEPEK
jgi:hypothetical protein